MLLAASTARSFLNQCRYRAISIKVWARNYVNQWIRTLWIMICGFCNCRTKPGVFWTFLSTRRRFRLLGPQIIFETVSTEKYYKVWNQNFVNSWISASHEWWELFSLLQEIPSDKPSTCRAANAPVNRFVGIQLHSFESCVVNYNMLTMIHAIRKKHYATAPAVIISIITRFCYVE